MSHLGSVATGIAFSPDSDHRIRFMQHSQNLSESYGKSFTLPCSRLTQYFDDFGDMFRWFGFF